ncbi:IS110 family transposase [Lentilactobacillus buchneri]|nr:IS110 family transposase [Lentilactobacillus buchneri]RRG05096.1 MAG: IS110 family transposase [Lactobacillus sp.]BEJ52123.1 IS110 family transposase [Lentilactobacillus buchneri subsp. silagei]MCT3543598.1 IS110 family transposase [Lentilactobacillus buchneri]MCT3545617.1 IS110 family transposase [Lentilactobacillus buchneri]
MIYAGIDVAKYEHHLSIIDDQGTVLLADLEFLNNREGFLTAQATLDNARTADGQVQVGLENTGHYGYNLISYLRQHKFQVFAYNPLLIKKYIQANTLRHTKTDPQDALEIAKKLRSDTTKVSFEADADIIELKSDTRYLEGLKRKRVKTKLAFTNVLDQEFPELAPNLGPVSAKYSQWLLALLKRYPSTDKLAHGRINTMTNIITKYSMKQHGEEMAIKVRELARETIGQASDSLSFQLLQLIDALQFETQQIKEADQKIHKIMNRIKTPLLSIPGVGETLAAIILAEIRNVNYFQSPNQILAFAGAEPSIIRSGEMQGNYGHMVKHGSTQLRWALFQAARLCAMYSPTMRAYYQKKRSEGKPYLVALSHVVKKLVRIIYHILKYNDPWSETVIRD